MLSSSRIYPHLGESLPRACRALSSLSSLCMTSRIAYAQEGWQCQNTRQECFLRSPLPRVLSLSLALKACSATRVVGCWVLRRRSHSMATSRAAAKKGSTIHADRMCGRADQTSGPEMKHLLLELLVFGETASRCCKLILNALGPCEFSLRLA